MASMRERGRSVAVSLGATLVGLAATAGGVAVLLESGDPQQSLDPHDAAAGTAGGFAAAFCLIALGG